ncbi:MAG: DUF677 domain-containing protein [Alphaproteobacteria bacterium]|nr:DUF677 domain-containing protein [Alphaproteobacteria bacterium]NNF23450.1 hypothetical protein [Paracoccaceae bacterium]
MPLDRLVLILVMVVVAAGVTVLIASYLAAALQVGPAAGLVAIPVLLVGYVIWRVIADRVQSREDDHYDHIEK